MELLTYEIKQQTKTLSPTLLDPEATAMSRQASQNCHKFNPTTLASVLGGGHLGATFLAEGLISLQYSSKCSIWAPFLKIFPMGDAPDLRSLILYPYFKFK